MHKASMKTPKRTQRRLTNIVRRATNIPLPHTVILISKFRFSGVSSCPM
jgi:hypothetical protein